MLTNQLWNLGTAPSGSDGDSARGAGEKYNVHEHPGQEFARLADFNAWKDSEDRIIGDIAVYDGITYVWNGVAAIPLGIGAVDPGDVKIEEIVLSTKREITSVGGEELAAADFFDPTEYSISRFTEVYKFRVVGQCTNPIDPIYSTVVRIVDNTDPDVAVEKYMYTFDNTEQIGENISDAIELEPSRKLYELQVECTNCNFTLYKAAIRVEYST
jgi:hypothetical protein